MLLWAYWVSFSPRLHDSLHIHSPWWEENWILTWIGLWRMRSLRQKRWLRLFCGLHAYSFNQFLHPASTRSKTSCFPQLCAPWGWGGTVVGRRTTRTMVRSAPTPLGLHLVLHWYASKFNRQMELLLLRGPCAFSVWLWLWLWLPHWAV